MTGLLQDLYKDPWMDAVAGSVVILGVDGLAVSVLDRNQVSEVLWCSGDLSSTFEDLQFTVGQGPGPDAARTGGIILVTDLGVTPPERWSALVSEMSALSPVRAVFAFPLGIGAVTLGVLTAVRRTPGPLSEQQADDAVILAATLTARFLHGDAQHTRGAAILQPTDSLHRAVVHQATGMLSVQLSLPLPQTMMRLRAHAYATGRPLTEVAQDIVARRLRLDDDGDRPVPHADKD
ncbi:ANTAR domain-containing protein (plasmid) [Kitasatospora sp. NBC_00070]|uniref:GAF and ANTAR domain-containing protein n=1 Tax=Kitasatospora sp. NBC_00070 TaxID=2975962 RepID=UPI003245A97C